MSALSLLSIPVMDIWSSIGQVFDTLMEPLYWAISAVLVFFHWVFAPLFGTASGVTWVLAIVSLTTLIRILIIPLYIKTIRSSQNMQAIQPQVQELQKKYGADRQKLGEETMKLYKEEGANPMSSCLPILLQLPVFWALYQVLSGVAAHPNPMARGMLRSMPELVDSLRNAHFLGASLSGTFMPMTSFGATQIMALVLILIMTGVMFYMQLHMMRKNMAPTAMTGPYAQTQKTMLYVLPVVYAIGGISIPIGTLIYWTTTNVWSLLQQWVMIRIAPSPNTPAFAEWEARMERKGRDPKEIIRERERKRKAKLNKVPAGAEAPTTVQRQVVRNGRVVKSSGVQRQASTRATGSTAPAAPTEASETPKKAGGRSVSRSASPKPAATASASPTPKARAAAPSQPPAQPGVVRQQPRRQSRSVRRKGQPTSVERDPEAED